MAEYILKDCRVYVATYDLSAHHNQVILVHGAETRDATQFGDSTRVNIGGLKTIEASGSGYWQAQYGDKAFYNNVGVANAVITICPTDGTGTEPAYFFKALQSQYGNGGAIGDIFSYSWAAASSEDDLIKGVVASAGQTATTTTGATQNLGAVTSSQKMWAALHVYSWASTGTLRVYITSDDAQAFGSPATRLTFTALNEKGSQATYVSGAITDTYWHSQWTIEGGATADLIVSMGIL